WRAFSQWRSSWLSREGVVSVLTFAPLLVLAFLIWTGRDGNLIRIAAAALALLAVGTVACTAMIYASLKTIVAWNDDRVLPGYLLFALLGGGAWLWAIVEITIRDAVPPDALPIGIAVIAAGTAVLKRSYWLGIDAKPLTASTETATGLGRFGSVRSAE